jgi:hypothetical protein
MSESKEVGAAAFERSGRITPHRPLRLQICLTRDERTMLADKARKAGYETVSAYVRARTLGPAAQR